MRAVIHEAIVAVGIDSNGQLFIKPSKSSFPMIYREAAEVSWDAERFILLSPKPREWSYTRWFGHLVAVANDQGVALELSPATVWIDFPNDLRNEIQKLYGERGEDH